MSLYVTRLKPRFCHKSRMLVSAQTTEFLFSLLLALSRAKKLDLGDVCPGSGWVFGDHGDRIERVCLVAQVQMSTQRTIIVRHLCTWQRVVATWAPGFLKLDMF